MGSFFSPSPPPPPPPPPAMPDSQAEAAKTRQEMLERMRRGRAGTIAESERGFLATAAGPGGGQAGGKRLLGE